MKTIISANIPVELAQRLQSKTKGTRSRVIERALRAYLDDRQAFDITDVETRTLAITLKNRDIPEHIKRELINWLMEDLR